MGEGRERKGKEVKRIISSLCVRLEGDSEGAKRGWRYCEYHDGDIVAGSRAFGASTIAVTIGENIEGAGAEWQTSPKRVILKIKFSYTSIHCKFSLPLNIGLTHP